MWWVEGARAVGFVLVQRLKEFGNGGRRHVVERCSDLDCAHCLLCRGSVHDVNRSPWENA